MSDVKAEDFCRILHDGLRCIREECYRLREKSEALESIGLGKLSIELARVAGRIEEYASEIAGAYGSELDRQVKEADQRSANMLAAMLSVVK